MPTQYQGINVPALFMAAQQMRLGRQQEQQNALQLSALGRQEARQAEIDAALRAGDMARWAQLDPMAAAKYQESQYDTQKKRAEIAKTASELTDAETKRNQNAQQIVLGVLAQNPNDPTVVAKAKEARDNYVKNYGVRHFALPGEDAFSDLVPSQVSQGEVDAARRAAGYEAPKPTSVQEYEYALTHPGYDAREITLANAKSSKTNVNVGGQTLPANQLAEIADFNTAIESLSNLRADFKKLVPSADVFDQIIARGEANVPNSPVAQYNDLVLQAQQLVGLILENGKLVGQDEAKYRKMLPKPGDSYETVQLKIDSLIRDLSIKGRNRAKAYGQGGYRVPEVMGGAPSEAPRQPSQADAIARRAAELKASGVSQQRALQIMREEGYDLGGQQ